MCVLSCVTQFLFLPLLRCHLQKGVLWWTTTGLPQFSWPPVNHSINNIHTSRLLSRDFAACHREHFLSWATLRDTGVDPEVGTEQLTPFPLNLQKIVWVFKFCHWNIFQQCVYLLFNLFMVMISLYSFLKLQGFQKKTHILNDTPDWMEDWTIYSIHTVHTDIVSENWFCW